MDIELGLREISLEALQASPPSSIDIDNPSLQTKNALSTLCALSDLFRSPTSRDKAERGFLNVHRHKAWPWISALSKAILDKEPTSAVGYDLVKNVLGMSPPLYWNGLYPKSGEDRDLSPQACLETATTITRMWLLSSSLDHADTIFLSDCASGYWSRVFSTGLSPSRSARSAFREAFDSKESEFVTAFLRDVTRELDGRPMNYSDLQTLFHWMRKLCWLTVPTRDQELPYYHSSLLEQACKVKAIMRSAVHILKCASESAKLASKDIGYRHCAASCLQNVLLFLDDCIHADRSSIFEALDRGVISAIFRCRDIIADDWIGRAIDDTNSLAAIVSGLFKNLASRLYDRPLMVRVIRAARKVALAGLDLPGRLEGCGPLHSSWDLLYEEAIAKREVLRNRSTCFWKPICEYPDVRGFTL
ncbi:hypothetical protein V5O48_006977 [Marasmius crinis-equi]|uniref:Uncharacterized protein n=1 Tax=Marasmius crinis-equi TaxID=585013 RepID=A0ABR3FI04_9AGAR